MLSTAELKRLLHANAVSRSQQVLLCLAAVGNHPSVVADVRAAALDAGLRQAKNWNISAILGGLTGLVIRTRDGWELTDAGRAEVSHLAGDAPAAMAASTLRTTIDSIKNADVRAFLAEAIGSAEAKHYRAAVVLSWVGAVAVLYDHVVAYHLNAFNGEAKRRDAKWRDGKSSDDLARMKEHDFLQILEAIGVIGKNVKSELEGCLKLRNAAGHPNSLIIAAHRVASHIETLALNVFSKFI